MQQTEHVKDVFRRGARRLTASPSRRSVLRALTHGGWLPRAVWWRLPVDIGFAVRGPGFEFKYVSDPGDTIGRSLYWKGLAGFESESLGPFIAFASRAKTFVDVGANTGLYSLIACAANPTIRVLAFEPVDRVRLLLNTNIDANGFRARCDVRAHAVAEREGSAPLHVPHGEVPKSASMCTEGFRSLGGEPQWVPVTTIDTVREQVGPIDLMKIDVEGFEDTVLAGATQTLELDRPTIIVECNHDGPCAQVEATLARWDYGFFHMRPAGLHPSAHIEPDPRDKFRNWLCLPAERARLFSPTSG